METLEGFTIDEWKRKYEIADADRLRYADVCGQRLRRLISFSAMAQRICICIGVKWPEGETFEEVIYRAFSSRNLATTHWQRFDPQCRTSQPQFGDNCLWSEPADGKPDQSERNIFMGKFTVTGRIEDCTGKHIEIMPDTYWAKVYDFPRECNQSNNECRKIGE
jgi:hypothetical protein